MNSDYPQPILVPPGSGKELKFLGVTHKLTYNQTNGEFYLFEFEFDPESGNRLHVHSYEDEIVYVLEGAIDIRLDNQKLQTRAGGVAKLPKRIPHALYNPLKTRSRYLAMAIPAGAGGVAKLPKRIPHALYNPLKTRSRYLAMAIPGGMEKFFDDLSAAKAEGTLDDATHRKISLKYGIEWLE
jgi:quercetin dioxygenase-like cupin family protein